MPRITRSCKDMSINEVQSKIRFPQRKIRLQCEKQIKDSTKKETLPKNNRTTRKRVAVIQNDENSCSPLKSPRKDIFASPTKSPLIDCSNICKYASPGFVKRKLDLESDEKFHEILKIPQNASQYSLIRQSLHTSVPTKLVSRDKELDVLKKFVKKCVVDSHPGSLYMSGAPGTGKTACLAKTFDEFQADTESIKTVFVNCMSLKFSQSIFTKLVEELTRKTCLVKNAEKQLEKYVTTEGPKILLILDEIDQLESKNQEILYKLFEMPFLPKSRLILIGIANALDLTDRILPRLQARSTCKPLLIQFPPYSKSEIAAILQDRIKEIKHDIIDELALQFCARKVSAMTGDVRKALDILRRSIELVESEWKKSKTVDESLEIKKVTISHVASVCSEVYGSRISTPKTKVAFPLQQKIVICTLMVNLKDKKIKEITNAKLYESYCRVCRSRQINVLSQEEFGAICTLLESQGILSVKEMKDVRNNKISLRLQESEVEHALQDKTLLSSILSNGVPS